MKNIHPVFPRLGLPLLLLLIFLITPLVALAASAASPEAAPQPGSSSALGPLAWQVDQPTSTPSDVEGEATATVEPTNDGTPYQRPLIVIDSYNYGDSSVTPGQQIDLVVKLTNKGELDATNILLTFTPGDFVPQESGGVLAMDSLDVGDRRKVTQPLVATYDIVTKSFASVVMQISYTDINGIGYSGTFNITMPVKRGSGRAPTATPTVTPTPSLRPQLVITSYSTNVPVLQPGSIFNLNLQVENVGNANAKRVTMILGGGSGTSGAAGGTQEPGGVSGGSGDFGSFAPVSSSNVQFIGDMPAGASYNAKATLIVNSSTNPGAYPMKISFTFVSDQGITYTDDQVITLLVYSLPLVDVNFYRDPGQLLAGQPNQLPLQIVNLGRKATILGNMKVIAQGAQLSNSTTLIGALDTGGYFTLDAMAIPDQAGPLQLTISIDYTDDFNQPQVITKTIEVEVMESPEIGPGGPVNPGEPGSPVGPDGKPLPGIEPQPSGAPETTVQTIVRFFKGLLGMDSALPTSQPGEIPPGEVTPEGVPGGGKPVPVPAVPGGKG